MGTRYKRNDLKEAETLPGPGNYNPDDKLVRKTIAHGWGMGTGKRDGIPNDKLDLPGPGTY